MLCIYIYIYICIEGEREREINISCQDLVSGLIEARLDRFTGGLRYGIDQGEPLV